MCIVGAPAFGVLDGRGYRMTRSTLARVLGVAIGFATLGLPGPLAAQRPPVIETFGDPFEIPVIKRFLADTGFGAMSPRAPSRIDEFGRLAGIWMAEQEVLQEDGTWVEGEPALWVWKYTLGGFAVQDLWFQSRDRLPDYLGDLDRDYLLSSIRIFDVREERWKVAWMANGAAQAPGKDFGTMEATAQDDRLVMTGPPGDYGLQRVVFSDITSDSFRWSSEYSRDGGATWTTVMRVVARRYR